MANFIISVAYVLLLIKIGAGQERCIFGQEDDCYFPCHCETTPCNRTTGHCLSGDCETYYEMRSISDDFRVCQPGDQILITDVPTFGLYLVHPATKERLSNDLFRTVRTTLPSNMASNCSRYLDTSSILGITDTLMWEIDYERLYTISRYHKFRVAGTVMDLPASVVIDFDVRKTRTQSLESWSATCAATSSYVTCGSQSLTSAIYHARYVFIKANVFPLHCFVFDYVNLHQHSGYAADIDCDRCLQDDVNGCGNGYWCETCAAGWKPPDCREPCDIGYRGINCLDTYDWEGTFHSLTQSDGQATLVFSCDTVVADDIASNFFFHVERMSPVYSLQTFPYSRERVAVTWHVADDITQVKITIAAILEQQTITGKASAMLTIIPGTGRIGIGSDAGAINGDDSTDDNASNVVATALAVLLALSVGVIVTLVVAFGVWKKRTNSKASGRECATQQDDGMTAPPRLRAAAPEIELDRGRVVPPAVGYERPQEPPPNQNPQEYQNVDDHYDTLSK